MPTPAEILAEINTAYEANVDYEASASPAKARAFITTCLRLQRFTISSGGAGSTYIQNHPEALDRLIHDARRWLLDNDPNGPAGEAVIHLSLEGGRA